MKGKRIGLFVSLLSLGAVLFGLGRWIVKAQTQARVSHEACVGNCVVDIYFLHSEMGDRVAKEFYHSWYSTYYTLTGCKADWKSQFSFLLDVISDIVGAPGAPTLQCWQGVQGQAQVCAQQCRDYTIPDAKYAPNLKLTLTTAEQGYFEVKVDNDTNRDAIPERQTNAYSRAFRLNAYLRWNDGTPLLIHTQDMPSLSFPTWIHRGGYDDCVQAFGADQDRCSILGAFLIPSDVTTAVNFLNGALYDLTDQVTGLSSATGSFRDDGYVRLLSDGDSLTIRQGDFAGLVWIKTYNVSKKTHSQQVIPWDAHNGDVKITNHECTLGFSTCWIFGDRTDVDTYVFALQGPAEKLLPGTYQVEVEADLGHEKYPADNRAGYSYEASAVLPQQGQGESEGQTQGETLSVDSLPITDLAGPGRYTLSIPPGVPGALFRLSVPANLQNLNVYITAQSDHLFDVFVRQGERPVPDYPTVNQDYDCWMQATLSFDNQCQYLTPRAGEYYIFVNAAPGSAFQLAIEWIYPRATFTPFPTPTFQGTPPPAVTLTEVEPNDARQAANPWDMQAAFSGQLTFMDVDYLHVTFDQAGIYTFTLTPLSAEFTPILRLMRSPGQSVLYDTRAEQPGQPLTLTVGARAGEAFDLAVTGEMRPSLPPQTYQIALTQVLPDPDEPNDAPAQATAWDMAAPYHGYLIPSADTDYLSVTFHQSGIYTFTAVDQNNTLELRLRLIHPTKRVTLLSAQAQKRGDAVQLTFDASAGETFLIAVSSGLYGSFGSPNTYQLSLSNIVADPFEPNDTFDQATFWDLTQGPLQGFLWGDTYGDYIAFVAPATRDQSPVTFTVTNPFPNERLSVFLYKGRGYPLKSLNGERGQPLSLTATLETGQVYYLRISNLGNKNSLEPYTLSATYTPAESQGGNAAQNLRTVRFTGRVWLRTRFLARPLAGVEIYAQVGAMPAVPLGRTGRSGAFSGALDLTEGQIVRLWAAALNYVFDPPEALWTVDATSRSRRFTFYGSEAPVIQMTLTPTPTPAAATLTPSPRPRASATALPPSVTPVSPTPLPPIGTPLPPTPSPSSAAEQVRITGHLWRLFPNAEPAGVGAGQVLLTVNGVPQPVVYSMIDGSYTITLTALNAGDELRLSAAAPEDQFEPRFYQWRAEAGVTRWTYDFYSYWGTLTPPERDDQNRLYGWITDAEGRGIPGLYVIVQMGNSDALQRLGPTDANGYYEGRVRLPSRIMVSVWVQTPGYVPSRRQFFHAFAPEDRRLDFSLAPAP